MIKLSFGLTISVIRQMHSQAVKQNGNWMHKLRYYISPSPQDKMLVSSPSSPCLFLHQMHLGSGVTSSKCGTALPQRNEGWVTMVTGLV